jgi:hypothetical protein
MVAAASTDKQRKSNSNKNDNPSSYTKSQQFTPLPFERHSGKPIHSTVSSSTAPENHHAIAIDAGVTAAGKTDSDEKDEGSAGGSGEEEAGVERLRALTSDFWRGQPLTSVDGMDKSPRNSMDENDVGDTSRRLSALSQPTSSQFQDDNDDYEDRDRNSPLAAEGGRLRGDTTGSMGSEAMFDDGNAPVPSLKERMQTIDGSGGERSKKEEKEKTKRGWFG